jgi:hypothetical protein
MKRCVAIAEMAGAPTPTALLEHRSMTDYNLRDKNPTDLPERAVRALTEKMTVLPDTGRVRNADDLYLVVSGSGSEYLVDRREGRCDCPDAQHNLDADEQCKHERRVAYATGETPIPEWTDTDAIDPQLGLQTARSPVYVATDGGLTGQNTGEISDSTEEHSDDSPALDELEHEDCGCAKLQDGFPCFECYISGSKDLPE